MVQAPLPSSASSPHVTSLNSISNVSPAAWGLQSLPFPHKAEKSGDKTRRAVFLWREVRLCLLIMEPGRRVLQQQSLGPETVVHRKLCVPVLFTTVWLTLDMLLLFYQETKFTRSASFFKSPHSASIHVFKREKQSGKNKLPSPLPHILSCLKHEDEILKIHNWDTVKMLDIFWKERRVTCH